jgi:hypothetical protein
VKRSCVAVAATPTLLTSACTYHRARISYDDPAQPVPIREAEWEGELLGHVASNEGGAIWNNCTKSAETSLWAVIDDAQRMGGNAIGNVRWIPKKEKGNRDRPTCRKGWGWLAIWPVALTTVFMSSRVEAGVYRAEAWTDLIDQILARGPAWFSKTEQLLDLGCDRLPDLDTNQVRIWAGTRMRHTS